MTDANKLTVDNLYDMYCELEITMAKMMKESFKLASRGYVKNSENIEKTSYLVGKSLQNVMDEIKSFQNG